MHGLFHIGELVTAAGGAAPSAPALITDLTDPDEGVPQATLYRAGGEAHSCAVTELEPFALPAAEQARRAAMAAHPFPWCEYGGCTAEAVGLLHLFGVSFTYCRQHTLDALASPHHQEGDGSTEPFTVPEAAPPLGGFLRPLRRLPTDYLFGWRVALLGEPTDRLARWTKARIAAELIAACTEGELRQILATFPPLNGDDLMVRTGRWNSCDGCPWALATPGTLNGSRATELVDDLLDDDTRWFGCHESTQYHAGAGDLVCTSRTQQCVGAFVLLERLGQVSVPARIAIMQGRLKPNTLTAYRHRIAPTRELFIARHAELWLPAERR